MALNLAELLCSAYVALALPNADIACDHMDVVVESSEQPRCVGLFSFC